MSVIACVSRTIRVSPEEAFEKFVDFRNWEAFMPRAFRPRKGPQRALEAGDRVRMVLDTGVARIPVPVDVFSIDPPREVTWGGGNRLLHASHRFVFEDAGDGQTRLESHEEWTGLLTRIPPVARRVKQQAELVGKAQLAGFARWVER
jgi:hypothetical protein